MGFPRQEYWSGLPFRSPGNLPDPGIEPMSPELQMDSLPLSHQGSPGPLLPQWSLLCLHCCFQMVTDHAFLKKIKKEKREKDSLRVSEAKWSFTAAVGSEAVLDFHCIAISTTSSKFLFSSAFFCCSGTKPLSLRNWAPGALGLYQATGDHNCPLMVIKVHTPNVLAKFHTSPFLPFCVAETSTPHDNQHQFPLPLP